MSTKTAETYQERVAAAHHALFHDDPTDVAERLARFFEEVNEACQAFGMSREDAHKLVDYTYNRPVGDPAKEIGAAMLTLASLSVVAGLDLAACAEADLEKLQRPETVARIRAKRSTRHGRGPLPGFDPSFPRKDGGQEVEPVADRGEPCPHCKGEGCQTGDPEGAPLEACDNCNGSGKKISTQPASTALVEALKHAETVLAIYADQTGYTDADGNRLDADAGQHEGLLAQSALDVVRSALSSSQSTSTEGEARP